MKTIKNLATALFWAIGANPAVWMFVYVYGIR